MLTKKARLSQSAFTAAFKAGRRHHSPNLQLIYQRHPQFHGAAVVGKKVFKRAVKRNQLRRRLYGVLYRYSVAQQKTGIFILVAKPSAAHQPRRALLAEAHTLLSNIGEI